MKTVRLDSLTRNRIFFHRGVRYRVEKVLGLAGVSVQCLATELRTIRGRSFHCLASTRTEVWAAASEVEVRERRPPKSRLKAELQTKSLKAELQTEEAGHA